jgi:hypothetical protein
MLFNVNGQYAHQEHMQSSDLGMKSPAEVLTCFDEFGWEHEVSEATRLQKVSPTLSVQDEAERRLIWVSGYGDPKFPTFVSECTFPGLKKRLFGLLHDGPGIVELHTDKFDARQARQALELFVSNDEAGLRLLFNTR